MISINNIVIDEFNPDAIMKNIANRVKRNRLDLNLSQLALAKKSGVSLGSLKRFEQTGEISLKSLVMLALTLDATEEFSLLFKGIRYQSIDDLLLKEKASQTKRGRRNVF